MHPHQQAPLPGESGPDDREAGDLRVGAQLAEALDTAARELLTRDGVEHILNQIVAGALHAIPHTDRAGVSLLERDGTVTAHAPSDEVVAELDELQNTLGEGPCRDAIATHERVLVPDMSAAVERWPGFVPAARGRGIGAMVSFPLFAQNGSAAALNLYAAGPHAFDESSLETGALFASHAAIALHGSQRVAGLNHALRSRDVIGQAKGILIERFTLSEDAAFAMLVRSSQDTNIKLHAVAEWLVGEAAQGRRSAPANR